MAAGLWDWACAAYARPDARQACLRLQDEHGQNVCLLLWAAWARDLDATQLAAGAKLARGWEAEVVRPLRDVRRALKRDVTGIGHEAREGLCGQVESAELAAERVLLEGLQALGARAHGAADPVAALRAAVAAWGQPAPELDLADLAAKLE